MWETLHSEVVAIFNTVPAFNIMKTIPKRNHFKSSKQGILFTGKAGRVSFPMSYPTTGLVGLVPIINLLFRDQLVPEPWDENENEQQLLWLQGMHRRWQK
jgi:hypothetical protein